MKEKVPDVWKGRKKEHLELCQTIELIERTTSSLPDT
jgi:hypothetical protein